MDIFIIVSICIILFIVYFNLIASLITLLEENISTPVKILRIFIIWILPVLGFAIALRFSYQESESVLHTSAIPKLMRSWIYSDKIQKPNPYPQDYNAD